MDGDWMGNLPEEIRSLSIIYLAIPGSHNSMTYGITSKSKIGPDADVTIRRIYRICPWFVRRWAITQTDNVSNQLELGIRYFDLRVCQKEGKFYYSHALLCSEIFEPLQQIKAFIDNHPGEVVILDFQHFYKFSASDHITLQSKLTDLFDKKMYVRSDGPLTNCSLTLCEETGKQIIIVYRCGICHLPNELWPSSSWPTPWPNVASSKKLKVFLEDSLLTRKDYQGYVSQCILTPTPRYIAFRCFSSLRRTANHVCKGMHCWIDSQTPGPFNVKQTPKVNVFIVDFVSLKDGQFCKWVIELNSKLRNMS